MIDIQKHRMKFSFSLVEVEPGRRIGEGEEVTVSELATRVLRKPRTERDETAPMPFDHGMQRIDHQERTNGCVLQSGSRGISEPEPADDDIPLTGLQFSESKIGQRHLDLVKKARHQKRFSELDLEDFDPA